MWRDTSLCSVQAGLSIATLVVGASLSHARSHSHICMLSHMHAHTQACSRRRRRNGLCWLRVYPGHHFVRCFLLLVFFLCVSFSVPSLALYSSSSFFCSTQCLRLLLSDSFTIHCGVVKRTMCVCVCVCVCFGRRSTQKEACLRRYFQDGSSVLCS